MGCISNPLAALSHPQPQNFAFIHSFTQIFGHIHLHEGSRWGMTPLLPAQNPQWVQVGMKVRYPCRMDLAYKMWKDKK